MAKRRDTYIVTISPAMQEAFDKGMPVLLLPPDWPPGNDQLLKLFIDVTVRGSKDVVYIQNTEKVSY